MQTRAVLGELPNSTNVIKDKSKTLNPKLKKTPATTKTKTVDKKASKDVDSESTTHDSLFITSVKWRFLSVNPVTKSRLQLSGVSSMLIASKYEEINPPHAEQFCNITDNTYDKAEVAKMEADILKLLKFELGSPTVKTFLRQERFIGIACETKNAPSLQFEFLCYYLAELSLLDNHCVKFLPYFVAAAVVFLARFIVWPEVNPWVGTSALLECTGYISLQLRECVCILHDLYMARRGGSFQATREKYSQHKFKQVANMPSPLHLPNDLFEY
ncbi:Cyclin-like [Sesbania bispinosa]|nr:Cyclin-like [Sesbania bispinosa]